MAMIDRYKKSGGFAQLLQVLETCAPLKKQQLLNIIREETPAWADAVESKSINFDRIVSWPADIALEYLAHVTHLSFVIALKGLTEENYNNFIEKLSHQERRKIETVFTEIEPTASEISSSCLKVVGEVRKLIIDGVLKVDLFDKDLAIPNNFEIHLSKKHPLSNEATRVSFSNELTSPGMKLVNPPGTLTTDTQSSSKPEKTAKSTFSLATENRPEVLKTKIVELTQQLSLLLQQNKELKEKLEKYKNAA